MLLQLFMAALHPVDSSALSCACCPCSKPGLRGRLYLIFHPAQLFILNQVVKVPHEPLASLWAARLSRANYCNCNCKMLLVQVPSSGLSAKADNVANWRQQLRSWQEGIQERCAHQAACQHHGAVCGCAGHAFDLPLA
jgi:hypothetical protein